MSNRAINRVGILVWDDINNKWVPGPAPDSFLQTTQISGITPVGGKLPVDTELTVNGDIIVEDVDINSMPLTEVFVSGTVVVSATDLDIRDLNYNQDSVSVNVGHPIIISGSQNAIPVTDNATTLSIDDGGGSITVDGTVSISEVGITYQPPVIISGTQNNLAVNLYDGSGNAINSTGGKLQVDTEIEIPEGIAVNSIVPVVISGTQNALPVTDNNTTLSVDDGAGSLTVDGTISIGHPVVVSGTQIVTATDLDIRDLNYNQDSVSVSVGHPVVISGTLNALPVTDNNTTLSIDDGGGSITIDGTVTTSITSVGITSQPPIIISGTQNALPVTDNNTTLSVDDGAGSLTVDGGVFLTESVVVSGVQGTVTVDANSSDVTVDNASGGSAVNVQDGGNSITVDAANLDIRDLNYNQDSISANIGHPVVISGTLNALPITDNNSSLTVDSTDLDIRDLNYNSDSVSVSIGHPVVISGTVTVDTNSSNVTVDNAAGASAVNIKDGGNVISIDDAGGSITIDGTVTASVTSVGITSQVPVIISGTQNALAVTDNNTTLSVDDGSGSLTVDGTVSIGHPVVVSGTVTVDANSSDVTIDNAAGAAAVNIQDGGNNISIDDGGNSITIDGTVTANISSVGITSQVPVIISGTQNALAVTDNNSTLSVDDGADSLTIDGTVGISHPIVVSGIQNTVTIDANSSDVTVDNASAGSAVNIQDGGNSLTVDAVDLDIRDLNYNQDSVSASIGHPIVISGTLNALPVTDNSTTLSIDDGGGSITVDGTVSIGHPVVVSGTVTIDANSSNVTIDNAAGAAAVNIQDGGNAITVDGSVTSIFELGAASNRTPVVVSGTSVTPSQITITGGKRTIEVYNGGPNDVYYGGATAGPASGIPIWSESTKTWHDAGASFSVYLGITDGESATVRIVEYV